MTEQTIQPMPPDPLLDETRTFWRDIGKSLVRESMGVIDETARQIIGVAGILEGLYFHAITFADMRAKVAGGVVWLYLAPIILLLASIICALIVFFPDRSRLNFNSSEASKLIYEHTVAGKLLAVRLASLFLVLGISGVLAVMMVYLRG